MWEKICICTLASAVSIGATGMWRQDEPDLAEADGPAKKVAVKVAGQADPSDDLRDVYNRLKKIRAERLADKPQALSDLAAKLYRQAVAAVGAGQTAKARALTDAAREVTRALELSLKTRREEPADSDLPPPPRATTQQRAIYRLDTNLKEKLPPQINVLTDPIVKLELKKAAEGEKAALQLKADPKISGNVRLRVKPSEGADSKRNVIIEKLESDDKEVASKSKEAAFEAHAKALKLHVQAAHGALQEHAAKAHAQAARATADAAREKVANALTLQLKAAEGQKTQSEKLELELSQDELEHMKRADAAARLHESLAGLKHPVDGHNVQVQILEKAKGGPVDSDATITELKKAYETIVKARKDAKGTKVPYLEAARDLYHSARREAEAKHFERAMELARAAEALMKASDALENVHVETHVIDGSRQTKVFTTKPHIKDDRKVKVEVVKPKEVRVLSIEKSEKPGDGTHSITIDDAKPVQLQVRKIEKKVDTTEGGDHKVTIEPVKPVEIQVRTIEKKIDTTDGGEHKVTIVSPKPHTGHVELRTEVHADTKAKDEKADGAKLIIEKLHPKLEKSEDGKQVRIELKKRDEKSESAKGGAGELTGIGIMLSFEDGKGHVDDLIPGSPAAASGKVKKGDSLLGIETDKGATIGFGDKSLEDVMKLLRGPAGSKVKVIVQSKGSNNHKVIEIERKKLEVPSDTKPKEGGSLPPVID